MLFKKNIKLLMDVNITLKRQINDEVYFQWNIIILIDIRYFGQISCLLIASLLLRTINLAF